MRRLLVVRHGETGANAAGQHVSSSDPDLNDRGQQQVGDLARRLGRLSLDRVVVSPKLRCVRTAAALVAGQSHDVETIVDDRMLELGFGELEGLSAADVEARGMSTVFEGWRQGVPPLYPDGAETFEAAASRVGSVFDEAAASDVGTIALVGHSHAMRIMLAVSVLGVSGDVHRRLRLDHARVTEIQWEGSTPRIVSLNSLDVQGG